MYERAITSFMALILIGLFLPLGLVGWLTFGLSDNQKNTKAEVQIKDFCGTPAIFKDNSLSELEREQLMAGEVLFETNCQQCHKIQERLVGPPLIDVLQKHDTAWVVAFIKNPQKVIDSGDPYARQLVNKYEMVMPENEFLDDGEILMIVRYIEWYAKAH